VLSVDPVKVLVPHSSWIFKTMGFVDNHVLIMKLAQKIAVICFFSAEIGIRGQNDIQWHSTSKHLLQPISNLFSFRHGPVISFCVQIEQTSQKNIRPSPSNNLLSREHSSIYATRNERAYLTTTNSGHTILNSFSQLPRTDAGTTII
jgi:hypothetical protein